MDLTASQRVAVPRSRVWEEIGDLPALAARLGLKALTVEDAGDGAPVAGRVWHARLDLKGARRDGILTVREARAPERLDVAGDFGNVAVTLSVDLAEDGPGRSAVAIVIAAVGGGLTGRAFLQTLRLMRPALEAKLSQRLADCARDIERRAGAGDQVARPGSAGYVPRIDSSDVK